MPSIILTISASKHVRNLVPLQVWRDAGTQVFFSYAVCQGVLTALGSYNKYNNNCYRSASLKADIITFIVFFLLFFFLIFRYFWLVSLSCSRDCLALCCLNSATSIFAGFAVFSVLGFMAQDLNISLEDISAGGKIIAYKEVK